MNSIVALAHSGCECPVVHQKWPICQIKTGLCGVWLDPGSSGQSHIQVTYANSVKDTHKVTIPSPCDKSKSRSIMEIPSTKKRLWFCIIWKVQDRSRSIWLNVNFVNFERLTLVHQTRINHVWYMTSCSTYDIYNFWCAIYFLRKREHVPYMSQ